METWLQDRKTINYIESIVLQLDWMWREQPTLDIGIDGQIEICDDDKKPTAKLFAVQAKGGDSYFYRRKTDSVLTICLQKKHLQYWNIYPLPVLVIGNLPQEDPAYWLYIQDHLEQNPDILEAKTKSVTIEIPDENIFDANAKPSLRDIPDRHQKLTMERAEVAKSKAICKLKENVDHLDRTAQSIPENHVPIAKQLLMSLSQGLRGSGVRTIIDTPFQKFSDHGSLLFCWKLGALSPKLMLADYIGEVHSNRLSIILNPQPSLTLRIYQKNGSVIDITSKNYQPHEDLVALAVWKRSEVSLWVNGQQFGPAPLESCLDSPGPLLLFGLDVENQFSADSVQWAPPEKEPGLIFLKDSIGHDSRFLSAALWHRALDDSEIALLSADPFAMYRPRLCNDGKCPDCGFPVIIDKDHSIKEPDERLKRLDGSRATSEDFSPCPPAIWCVCTNCGKPCLNEGGFPG